MDDPFVTVPEIARELGVSEVTVRVWIREGRLPARRLGRAYRIRRSDIDRMTAMDRDGHQPAAPSGPVSLESESPLMAQVIVPDDER